MQIISISIDGSGQVGVNRSDGVTLELGIQACRVVLNEFERLKIEAEIEAEVVRRMQEAEQPEIEVG